MTGSSGFGIKLLKLRVSADELWDDVLHEADHIVDFYLAGEAFEFVYSCQGVGIVIFTDFGDADTAVVGREGVLVVGEYLFVEFFAWAKAAVLNLDVNVRRETGESDHAAGKVVDLDGFSHVEDEDLVACGHCRSFHHEAAGLRDGHEEACDLRMSNCHRTSLCNLLTEAWDHGAVGAEDVTEASGDKAGLSCFLALFHCESH